MNACKVILVGFAWFAAAGFAQNTGVVAGVMRDSVTNAPIPGAHARLLGVKGFVVEAGTDGRFRMDDVPEGKYKLDGYVEGYVGPSTAQDLDIRFTSGVFNADVTLDPLAVVKGRVVDDRGQPVVGSTVLLSSSPMKTTINTKSDAEGRFLFKEVYPGPAVLSAIPPRREKPAEDAGKPRIEMLETYYPAASDPASATEVQVVPGDRNDGYDIRMIEERVQRVRGVVRNSKGELVASAGVILQSIVTTEPLRMVAWGEGGSLRSDSGRGAAVAANMKGEFEFPNVPAGAWRIRSESRPLVFRPEQLKEPTEAGQLLVNVSRGDIEGADIRLEPPFDLLITYEGLTTTKPDPFRIIGIFNSAAGVSPPFMSSKMEQISEDSVMFHGISPGEYVVDSPRGPGMGYTSVTVGGQEAIGRKVELRPGTPVHITFSNTKSSIRGSVDRPSGDGRGVSVLLFPPAEADAEPVRYLAAGSDGGFEFAGLRPATYSVVAVQESERAKLSDSALPGLRSKSKYVKLDAGTTEMVTLSVQAAQ